MATIIAVNSRGYWLGSRGRVVRCTRIRADQRFSLGHWKARPGGSPTKCYSRRSDITDTPIRLTDLTEPECENDPTASDA